MSKRHARATHAEVIERARLEAIATDPTKSEPERELARERIQQLRDAAVARAKLRDIKGEDVTKPRNKPETDTASDLPVPVKPTREADETDEEFKARLDEYWDEMRSELEHRLACWHSERWFILVDDLKPCLEMFCGDQDEFKKALESWQLCLDENAAQKVLDSPSSTFSARQTAERKLRKSEKRRRELDPDSPATGGKSARRYPFPNCYDDPGPTASKDERPFQSQHKPGSEEYVLEMRALQKKIVSIGDYLNREDQWKREDPSSYAAELVRREEEDAARRRKNLSECSYREGNPWHQPEPYIASPLQKQAWQAQSEKFAKLRGEIVEPKPAPLIEPERRIACRIVLDGSLVWSDGTPCPNPLPLNTRIFNAPTPPSYVQGSGKVPEGFELDFISMVWVRR